MNDYAALLDRAISRQTRDQFIDFLASHRHVEFGQTRFLDPSEITLILTVVDRFYLNDGEFAAQLESLKGIHSSLSICAGLADHPSAEELGLLRNACFDALAYIKTLEARLCAFRPQAALRSRTTGNALSPCNDT